MLPASSVPKTASRQNRGRWSLPSSLQWVAKISKFCNLRCRYCYEFNNLADRTRMALDQIERMFIHIAREYGGSARRMDFVWHGGEPLLIECDYYEAIFRVQVRVLGPAGIRFTNSIQTNLTHLTSENMALLKRYFSNVGVSIDLFGEQRVTPRGKSLEQRVITNMQRLRAADITFGCITVLSRATVGHVAELYRFFEDCTCLSVSCQFTGPRIRDSKTCMP
jgi:uncharacterized protein